MSSRGRLPPKDHKKSPSKNVSERDLEDIITETVRSTLEEVLPTAVSSAISKALSAHDKRINQCFKKVDDNKAELDSQMDKLKTEMYAEIEKMKADNNEKDNDSRLKNVRINGLAEAKPEENLKKIVREMSQTMVLNPETVIEDIEVVHRIGKPTVNTDDHPRPVIIKFKTYPVHGMFIRARRQLKGWKIFINDDLTPHTAKQFAEASKLVGNGVYFASWTVNGKIWLKKGDKNEPIRFEDLTKKN